MIFLIAWKSLINQKKKYRYLFLVCIFGAGISFSILSIMNGMLFSLREKAKIYYGGDLLFIGGQGTLDTYNTTERINQLKSFFPANANIVDRIDYDANQSSIFFEGTDIRQRVIKGIDFSNEKEIFQSFNYLEGNADNMANSNGILLSQPAAKKLGIHTGDIVTLLAYTINGQLNTIQLDVKGIFQDSSLFGAYTSYLDIDCLASFLGYPADFSNRIAIFFSDSSPSDSQIDIYRKLLSSSFKMHEKVYDKQIFYDYLFSGAASEEPEYALIELDANMQDLRLIIDAMKFILYLIIILLVAIIAIGIGSTYRIIAIRRIKEVGMYMALGMPFFSILKVFLSETTLLVAIGCFTGLVSGVLLSFIVGSFNFSYIPAFDLFLQNGHLISQFNFPQGLALSAAILATTLTLVCLVLLKTVKVNPVTALSSNE